MKSNQDHLNLMRQINNSRLHTKRTSKRLRFSLGKLNYCIKALKEKGMVKIKNFKKIKIKSSYICINLKALAQNKINN